MLRTRQDSVTRKQQILSFFRSHYVLIKATFIFLFLHVKVPPGPVGPLKFMGIIYVWKRHTKAHQTGPGDEAAAEFKDLPKQHGAGGGGNQRHTLIH